MAETGLFVSPINVIPTCKIHSVIHSWNLALCKITDGGSIPEWIYLG